MTILVDLLALLLLAAGAVRGWLRGTLLSILGIVSLAAGYLAAWFGARPLGNWLQTRLEWAHIASRIAAAVLLFLVAAGIVSLLARRIKRSRRRLTRETGESGLSLPSRAVGLLLGAAGAFLVIVALCWCYSLARGSEFGRNWPDISTSYTMRFVRPFIQETVYFSLRSAGRSPQQAQRLARLAAEPGHALLSLEAVLQSDSIRRLMADTAFGEAVLEGSARRIYANSSYRDVMRDDLVIDNLQELGMVPPDIRRAELARDMAEQLAALGERLGRILREPEVREKLDEMRAEGLLQRDNLHRLMLDGRIYRILDRLLPDDPADDN